MHEALIHAVFSCYHRRSHDVSLSSPCAACGDLHFSGAVLSRLCQKAGVPLRSATAAAAQVEPLRIIALSAPPRCQKAFLSFCVHHHLYIALSHCRCSISCREALSLVGSCAISAATFPLSSFQSRALALLRVGLTVPANAVADCSSKQAQHPNTR